MNSYELNTARNCLRVIIRQYGIKEIFIPYYICPVVWQACRVENCKVKFYHIDKNFYPMDNFNKSDYILYPNYFGICSDNVFKLADLYPNLIVDNAQALFMPHCGLVSFTSYRKFLPCSDGAKLFIEGELTLPVDKYSYNNTPQNYNEFVQNELRLNKEEPQFINPLSKEIIAKIDLNNEEKLRLNKFYEWDKKLFKTNKLKIKLSDYDIPFVYPYLSENDINIETLRYWNALPENFPEYEFYKNLKPIPLIEVPYLK